MENYMGAGMYPRHGTHTVEIELQDGDFKGKVIYQIGGNCMGGEILQMAISALEEGEFEPDMSFRSNQKHVEVDEEGYVKIYKLFKGNEDELHIDYDDNIIDNIVGAKIIDWKAEK